MLVFAKTIAETALQSLQEVLAEVVVDVQHADLPASVFGQDVLAAQRGTFNDVRNADPACDGIARRESATARWGAVARIDLLQIVREQSETGFGRDHGFDQIRSVADFRRQGQVSSYEQLEPYIARVRRGDELTHERLEKCLVCHLPNLYV